jgi:hypothetical protein
MDSRQMCETWYNNLYYDYVFQKDKFFWNSQNVHFANINSSKPHFEHGWENSKRRAFCGFNYQDWPRFD